MDNVMRFPFSRVSGSARTLKLKGGKHRGGAGSVINSNYFALLRKGHANKGNSTEAQLRFVSETTMSIHN